MSSPPVPPPPATLPEDRALDASISDAMARGHVLGVSASVVALGNSASPVVWQGEFGEAAPGRPVTAETLFQVASVSKTVTTVVVLQQVEAGAISLDAPVNDVLPFQVHHPRYPDRSITVRHLLTHSSGLKDNWDVLESTTASNADFHLPLGESLRKLLVPGGEWYSAKKSFSKSAPGSRNRYSNVGMALAAYAAEAASGRTFETLAADGIFVPLRMSHTSFRLNDLRRDLIAEPHEYKRSSYVALGHHGYLDYPAGTLRVTPTHLRRFLLAIMRGGEYDGARILRQATVNEMLRVQDSSLDATMCLGWFQEQFSGVKMFGHDGGDPGVSAEMWFHPNGQNEFGVILMMNSEPSDAILSEILNLLINKGSSVAKGGHIRELHVTRNTSRSRRLLAARSRSHEDI